jgi:hypothetical protein
MATHDGYAFDDDNPLALAVGSTSFHPHDAFDLDPGNTTAPVIGGYIPAPSSTIVRDDVVIVDVTDDLNQLGRVFVTAEYPGLGVTDLVYDGTFFVGAYQADSTANVITNGLEFALSRTGGWRASALTLHFVAVDEDGNETTADPSYTVSNPQDGPVVDTFSPGDGATIANDDTASFSVRDANELAAVVVIARYGGGLQDELVHDNVSFLGPFVAGSTMDPISGGGGFEYVVARSGGWPSSSVTFVVRAADVFGASVNDATYNLVVSNPTNAAAPVIGASTPASGSSISSAQSVAVNVTDDGGSLSAVFVQAEHGSGVVEVVHDGSSFAAAYAGSSRTPITNGYAFAIARAAGWPDAALVLRFTAVDSFGHVATGSRSFTVTDPAVEDPADVAAPVVGNVTPAPGTLITRASPLAFDVTDDVALRRVIVCARFVDGTYEVVHDGDAFAARYVSGSTRVAITSGLRYSIRRSGGWPSSPTIVPFPVDTSGNEA